MSALETVTPALGVVRYTVLRVTWTPKPPPSVSLRKETAPNGTYDFPAAAVLDAIDRIATRSKWQRPPERGAAVIRTWHNRHPATLARWVRERATDDGLVAEVPREAPPTWLAVAEDLVERRQFRRMTCPSCGAEHGPDALRFDRWEHEVPHYRSGGRRCVCPGGHVLIEIVEWWVHQTERGGSSWRREE